MVKLWWLVLAEYSYLPIPKKWQVAHADLPRALFLLSFWGVLAGLLLLLCARFGLVLGARWAAALLLGLQILLNGGVWLRDLLLVADGRRPPLRVEGDAPPGDAYDAVARPEPYRYSRAAVIVGSIYLLLNYWCYFLLLRWGYSPKVLLAAAVLGRWLYCWGVYDFAALAPAFLKQGGSLKHFRWASLLSLLVAAGSTWGAPALWPALVLGLLAGWLLYMSRMRGLGALDEPCYGAAAAWGETVVLLAAVVFTSLWG